MNALFKLCVDTSIGLIMIRIVKLSLRILWCRVIDGNDVRMYGLLLVDLCQYKEKNQSHFLAHTRYAGPTLNHLCKEICN